VASDSDAPKTWLRLRFACDPGTAASLAEQLSNCGALSVSLEDAEGKPLYEPAPGTTPLWSTTRVSALFREAEDIEGLLAVLAQRIEPATLPSHDVDWLEDCDWLRVHQDAFEPTCFGERLWVVPSWAEPPALGESQVSLRLDPGLAFGSGAHPTTAMCLAWLAGDKLDEAIVVDYGCGSGVLAVAAAKLGAHRVWAVDHDPQALLATRDNAAANAVGSRITVCAPPDLPTLTADFLVSNILANTLSSMAQTLSGLLEPGGRIALAGILNEQSSGVIESFAPWCALQTGARRGDWVLLVGTRGDYGA
jgi:ribosomal protein L11 methyltransferase